MPKFKIVKVTVQTVIIDTDKCKEVEHYSSPQEFAEVEVRELEFAYEQHEEDHIISWDEYTLNRTEEIE